MCRNRTGEQTQPPNRRTVALLCVCALALCVVRVGCICAPHGDTCRVVLPEVYELTCANTKSRCERQLPHNGLRICTSMSLGPHAHDGQPSRIGITQAGTASRVSTPAVYAETSVRPHTHIKTPCVGRLSHTRSRYACRTDTRPLSPACVGGVLGYQRQVCGLRVWRQPRRGSTHRHCGPCGTTACSACPCVRLRQED